MNTTMNKFIPILLYLVLFSSLLPAQDRTVTYYVDPSANPPDLMISLNHLEAHVRFIPEDNMVIATAEFTFTPNRYKTDSIVFYAPDFRITSIFIDGKSSDFRLQASNLIIYPPSSIIHSPVIPAKAGTSILHPQSEHKLKIEYTAQPQSGAIYFIGWRPEEAPKRKEIWAHRPHGWLPYMDARITVDMFVTFGKSYKVFSNGDRMETKDNGDKTMTWHYRMTKNHPFFSTALVIGDYDYKTSKTGRGVPLEYWYYPGQEDKVHTTYQYTEAMMDFLEKETGLDYPYPVYRQAPVIDYMYGAMETTTSTIFGDFMLIDRHAFWQRNYINTNAHELAHQWFGNYVSHLQNKDVWLTESFGTYYAKMFEKSVFGEDQYQNIKNDELQLALNAARNNNYPVGGSRGGNARIYQKGSLVLGMLQYVMGDREFHDAIRRYLEEHPYKNAETGEFIRTVYEVTGKPYNWFFEEWVLHGGEPEYKVSYKVRDDTTGQRATCISVTQVQETNDQVGLFKMPVRFEVHYKDRTMDETLVWVENKVTEIAIPNPEKKPIAFVLFDPGREIVKKVTFDKPFAELSAQALQASNMIDRYDALLALRSEKVSVKRDVLLQCYSGEKFFLTKAEIISQLSADTDVRVLTLFRKALVDPDALVRKEVLHTVSPVPAGLKNEFITALKDTSNVNIDLALQNLCLSYPEETDKFLEMTKNDQGWRGLNIRMRWLETAISSGKMEYLGELIGYTGPSWEFETRINALNVLKRLRYEDKTTLQNATSSSKHWNSKLSAAGKEYLNYFNNP